tara:strand:- start:357 stop:485 length:129 start_codon:yes stop_codon:yes gene_type:complete
MILWKGIVKSIIGLNNGIIRAKRIQPEGIDMLKKEFELLSIN